LKVTDISGRIFVVSNFFANLFFSCTLNLLWSMVNSLQVIVHLPLANLSLPMNAYVTSKTLSNVAKFDIIPTQYFYLRWFDFKVRKIPLRYKMLGFETRNFLLNSGTLFLLFMSWFLLILIYFIFRVFQICFKN